MTNDLYARFTLGGEMFDLIIKRGRLKEREAAKYFTQLISGIRYLHRNQIVHRDLKLENLLLDQHNNLIITDFGFAFSYLLPRQSRPEYPGEKNPMRIDKREENRLKNIYLDYLGTSCGSPTYAAPELVMMDSYLGPPTDIWSCGIILYGMLAGYLPFDNDPENPNGENVNLLYNFILRTKLEFPRWITSLPQTLISRMLIPDPMLRATMDEITRHEWLEPYDPYFDDEWLLKMVSEVLIYY
jgi:serine/threonine protein kinase